ncbi:MAG: hypothetical protein ACO3E6_05885 [Candidatus Nanopelagicaceae bacterium]
MKIRVSFIFSLATLVLTLVFWLLALNMKETFWDIEVYQFAVDSVNAGTDPYRNRSGFDFMYHPIILPILQTLDLIFPLKVILPSVYIIALMCLFSALNHWKLIPNSFNKDEKIVLGTLLLGYFGWGYLGILSGNLSLLGHTILHIFGLQLMLKKQTILQFTFFFIVLAFSLIKPYFLAYIVLYLVFSVFKLLLVGVVATVSFLALWIFFAVNNNDSYSQFTSNLTRGTFTNDDLGFSLFSTLQAFLGFWPAITLHFTLVLFLVAIYLKNKSLLSKNSQIVWLIVVAVISNPRVKEYDAIFLLIMAYIAAALSSTVVKKLILKTLTLTSFFGVVFVLIITYLFTQPLVVPLFTVALMALVWSIWFALRNTGVANEWALSGSNRRPTD